MANYSINLTDNGNGSFGVTTVLRAPTTVASGGTTLNAAAQFNDAASSNTWLALGDALFRAGIMCADDRAKNG
jgi:hypothetical protein